MPCSASSRCDAAISASRNCMMSIRYYCKQMCITHSISRVHTVSTFLYCCSHSSATSIRCFISKKSWTCRPLRRYCPWRTLLPNSTSSVMLDSNCSRFHSTRGFNPPYPYLSIVLLNPKPCHIRLRGGSSTRRSFQLHQSALTL